MALNQFLGFKKILSTAKTSMTDNYLYFVRDNGNAVEGELWFNGTCYGKCRDTEIDDIKDALAGFLDGGAVSGQTVKGYVDSEIAKIVAGFDSTASGESADGKVSVKVDMENGALTGVTVTTADIASASALTKEIADREAADTAITQNLQTTATTLYNMITGASDDLRDEIEQAIITSTGYTQTEIEKLDATVSATSTNSYMTVQVAEVDGKLDSVSIDDAALKAAIEAMDLAEVHEAGKAIVAVSEADGKVSATAGTIAAQYVDVADAAGKFTGSTVEAVLAEIDTAYKAADAAIVGDATTSGDTLGKLEDRIEALDADAKEYHIVSATTNIPEDIKVRYSLVDADGNVSGATIDIPKDSHIVSINYITTGEHAQNLEYVYLDVCGNTQTTYVDMSELVLETEFASGVSVTDHIAHGVVDQTSEGFLTVGANGFKLAGVQDAIDEASATAYTASTAYTDTRISALDKTDDVAVAGQYVAAIEETDGVVAVKTRANVSEAVLNNYAKGTDATAVAATDTVNQAVSKLENQIDKAKAAATTKVVEGTDAGNNMTIASATSETDGSVTYTINLTDVASKAALDAEIAARKAVDGQNGDTYAANTGANYISGATSLNDADVKLNTALGDLNDNMADLADALETTATTLTDMIEDEASARAAADTALGARLDVIEPIYVTGVTVNDVDATVTDHVADVTIQADDIELGEAVTGTTGGIHFDATANTQDVFQSIVDTLNHSVATSYTGVTSSDKSINLASTTNGQDLSVNTKTLQLADVQAGETEVKKDESTGALYGVMYWIDEETNE